MSLTRNGCLRNCNDNDMHRFSFLLWNYSPGLNHGCLIGTDIVER